MKKVYSLFLSPRGRIGRQNFIIGVAALLAFVVAQKYIFSVMGTGLISFFLPMIFFFLTLHIMLCVFGKRLHDINRTLWPLIGLIALVIIVALLVSLKYGGLDYIETVMAHPEYAENEAEMLKVQKTYQEKLAANVPNVGWVLSFFPAIFTLWLAVKKGSPSENKYGVALTDSK